MIRERRHESIPRWRVWPPQRALEVERSERQVDPRAFQSDIDPRYPVFGNPTTASVRENFLYAKEEIENLQDRLVDAETAINAGAVGGIPDAPNNMTLHARRGADHTWQPLPDAGIAEAPAIPAGSVWVRQGSSASWQSAFTQAQADARYAPIGTGGLSAVTVYAPLSGNGTTISPLSVTVASPAQVTAGTDNVNMVTSARLRQVTGDLASLTTPATTLVAAINGLALGVRAVDGGVF